MAATSTARTISEYNNATSFTCELRESRLKKCARIIDLLPVGRMLDIGCSTGDWLHTGKARDGNVRVLI